MTEVATITLVLLPICEGTLVAIRSPIDVAMKYRRNEAVDQTAKSFGPIRPKLSAGLRMMVLARQAGG